MKFSFHTDHHTAIGHTHLSDGKLCQDHALSGVVKEYGDTIFAFAVLSDGCSSGGETDIGARLLTTLTAKAIREDYVSGDAEIHVETEAYEVAEKLGLQASDLYATHLYSVIDTEGSGYVMVKGDGVVAFLHANCGITVYRFEWANNMPYYPLYSAEGLREFYVSHGGRTACALKESMVFVSPDGTVCEATPIEHTVEEGAAGIKIPIMVTDPELICLFSDGACQVDKMEWLDTIRALTAFKNRAGAFAKRRMIRFLKDTSKLGKGPLDDISFAVIAVTPQEIGKDPAMTANGVLGEKPIETTATLNASD